MKKVILLIEIKENEEVIQKKVVARKEETANETIYSFNEGENNKTTYKLFKNKFEIINQNLTDNVQVKLNLNEKENSFTTISYNSQTMKIKVDILFFQTVPVVNIKYILETDPQNIHQLRIEEKR